MITRLLRRLTRSARLVSYTPLVLWAWKYRNDIRRAMPVFKAAPRRVRARETADLITEAKVLHALAKDERTRGDAAIQFRGVHAGVAHLRLSGTSGAAAVPVVERVTGVKAVDVDVDVDTTTPLPVPTFA